MFSISCPSRQEDPLFVNKPILLMKVSSRTKQNMCVINQPVAICNLLQVPVTSLFTLKLSLFLFIDRTQMLMTTLANWNKEICFVTMNKIYNWFIIYNKTVQKS